MPISRRFIYPLVLLFVTSATVANVATVILGGTLIDGNGGEPLKNAAIVIEGSRIVALGPAPSIRIPRAARLVDAEGKYLIPGLIDSNVHITLIGGEEELLWYRRQFTDIAIELAQLHLKYGVTTIRDSYGALEPLLQAREAFRSGKVVGPRLLIAGNIIGWGGPFSYSNKSLTPPPESGPKTLYQERLDDYFSQGVGDELVHMNLGEVRMAINRYLDKGVDFIKYGGTVHSNVHPWVVFAPRVQRAIIEEAHKRGLPVDTHCGSPEALRECVAAGVDLIQHPEVHLVDIPDDLVELIVSRGVLCGIISNAFAGKFWETVRQADAAAAADLKRDDSDKTVWQRLNDANLHQFLLRFRNAKKLIDHGCKVALTSDSVSPTSHELYQYEEKEPVYFAPGYGTWMSLEGLVALGMTPMQALMSATRNGAVAARGLNEYGTLEVGKVADLLVLGADPLVDIRNIEKLEIVVKGGQIIDRSKLPTHPVLTKRGGSLFEKDFASGALIQGNGPGSIKCKP